MAILRFLHGNKAGSLKLGVLLVESLKDASPTLTSGATLFCPSLMKFSSYRFSLVGHVVPVIISREGHGKYCRIDPAELSSRVLPGVFCL